MNAVKIAVLNGGTVSQLLELEPGRAPHNVTVRAAKGSRFVVMGSDGEPTPQPIQTRRIGRNLLVDLDPEGVGLPSLIIEDFHAMQAELIGKDDDGTYHAYVQQENADTRFRMRSCSCNPVCRSIWTTTEQRSVAVDGLRDAG